MVIKLPVKRASWFKCLQLVVTLFVEHIYIENGNQFDENMKKYNEDNVNYTNSKRCVF